MEDNWNDTDDSPNNSAKITDSEIIQTFRGFAEVMLELEKRLELQEEAVSRLMEDLDSLEDFTGYRAYQQIKRLRKDVH